jgi:Diedel
MDHVSKTRGTCQHSIRLSDSKPTPAFLVPCSPESVAPSNARAVGAEYRNVLYAYQCIRLAYSGLQTVVPPRWSSKSISTPLYSSSVPSLHHLPSCHSFNLVPSSNLASAPTSYLNLCTNLHVALPVLPFFPLMLLLLPIFLTTVTLPSLITADCCRTSSNGYCPDGTASTTYCGVGSCNIFGCNCEGGEFQGQHSHATLLAVPDACLRIIPPASFHTLAPSSSTQAFTGSSSRRTFLHIRAQSLQAPASPLPPHPTACYSH